MRGAGKPLCGCGVTHPKQMLQHSQNCKNRSVLNQLSSTLIGLNSYMNPPQIIPLNEPLFGSVFTC